MAGFTVVDYMDFIMYKAFVFGFALNFFADYFVVDFR